MHQKTLRIKKTTALGILLLFVSMFLGGILVTSYQKPQRKVSAVPSISPTPDIKKLIKEYPYKGTDAEKTTYRTGIEQIAVATTSVKLKECLPTPKVATFPRTESVIFTNTDPISREIQIDTDTKLTIPPKESLSVSGDFEKGAGIHSYSCDAYGRIGILYTR